MDMELAMVGVDCLEELGMDIEPAMGWESLPCFPRSLGVQRLYPLCLSPNGLGWFEAAGAEVRGTVEDVLVLIGLCREPVIIWIQVLLLVVQSLLAQSGQTAVILYSYHCC